MGSSWRSWVSIQTECLTAEYFKGYRGVSEMLDKESKGKVRTREWGS